MLALDLARYLKIRLILSPHSYAKNFSDSFSNEDMNFEIYCNPTMSLRYYINFDWLEIGCMHS